VLSGSWIIWVYYKYTTRIPLDQETKPNTMSQLQLTSPVGRTVLMLSNHITRLPPAIFPSWVIRFPTINFFPNSITASQPVSVDSPDSVTSTKTATTITKTFILSLLILNSYNHIIVRDQILYKKNFQYYSRKMEISYINKSINSLNPFLMKVPIVYIIDHFPY
jgi:hypothetical protein